MHLCDEWLALARAPAIHAGMLRDAGHYRLNPAAMVGASPVTLRALGLPASAAQWLACPDQQQLRADRQWLTTHGAGLVCQGEAAFPEELTTIPDAPLCLYVQGDPSVLAAPQLAMVGARRPTQPGLRHAARFAATFCSARLAITSGLAIGIDQACHEAALRHGRTIAVLGSGLDRIYPAQHTGLAERIVAGGGALVSEFPPGIAPLPHHFPQRNRLISGLARALVVIEAASRSGTLITARLAADQGRTVYALPGALNNPMAEGCHLLIRQGVTLVTRPEEVLDELQIPYEKQELNINPERAGRRRRLDNAGKILLDALGYESASADQLAANTGLESAELAALLLRLELEGWVERQAGGSYSLLQN